MGTSYELNVTDSAGITTKKIQPLQTIITTTTNASGIFTVNLTNSAYTNIYSVTATAQVADGTMANVVGTSIYSVSTTAVTGIAYKAQGAILGLLGIAAAGAGITITVSVIGN